MENILVLTDFSDGAFHAAEWALKLAAQCRANLILFHSYLGFPVIPYDTYTGRYLEPETTIRLDEEANKSLVKFAERVERKAEYGPEEFVPSVKTELGEGSLSVNVKDLIRQKKIGLVVMGASDKTVFEHILNGNKVAQVMENVSVPLLIVPIKSTPVQLKKVAFAAGFDHAELHAFNELTQLSQLLDFDSDIVHIITGDENGDEDVRRTLMNKLDKNVQKHKVNYKAVKGKNVVQSLANYCNNNECDLLAITHHQYNVWRRLFYKSTTREAIKDMDIPILMFPAEA